MTDPKLTALDAAVAAAREDVFLGLVNYHWPSDTSASDKGCEEAIARATLDANAEIDALVAAAEARERARLYAVVAGLESYDYDETCRLERVDVGSIPVTGDWLYRADALTALLSGEPT